MSNDLDVIADQIIVAVIEPFLPALYEFQESTKDMIKKNARTYKEAMDLQRTIDSKVDSILLDVFGNEDTMRKDNAFRLLSATLLWTYKEIEKEAMNQEINP